MFKKFISMATAVLFMATGLSLVGTSTAVAANEKTLTIASKVKGVTVNLGTPSPFGGNPMGSVDLSASQAADTSNSGNFVTEFIPTDPQASVVVALYPNADFGMGNPSSFPGSYTYNGTDAVSDNQLFVIKVTQADNMSYQYYEIDVQIVSSDATLSFANSRLKSVTPGSATAYDNIAQLATSSNRTSITLSSTQASSTFGDQITYFTGAGMNATVTAKRFASSVSSLDSSVFTSATSVTSSTAIADGDYIVIRVIAEDATTTKYYGYSVSVTSGGGGGGGGGSSTDATLSAASTIKGVTVISLGTPGTNPNNIVARGTIHLSTAAAADTSNSGSYITNFITSNSSAVKIYVWKHAAGGNLAMSSNYNGSAAISNGDIFSIYVKSADSSTYKLYAIDVQVSSNGASPSASVPSLSAEEIAANAAAAQAAIQAAIAAAIVKAKTTLHGTLQGDKPGTLEQYLAADYKVNNEKVVEKVNAAVLKLPLADRENAEKIAAIIKVENFVDLVSTPATQKRVTSKALVELGLVASDNPNKTTIANALKKADAASLNSIEKIEEAIKAELAAVKERKDRLAEIKARIAGRNK